MKKHIMLNHRNMLLNCIILLAPPKGLIFRGLSRN